MTHLHRHRPTAAATLVRLGICAAVLAAGGAPEALGQPGPISPLTHYVGRPPGRSHGTAQRLVNANFGQKTDAQGFRWYIQSDGRVAQATSRSFGNGVYLIVNGNGFNSRTRMMTPGGTTYVLTGQAGPVQVQRRITFDLSAGVAWYVDTFTPPGGATNLAVELRVQFPQPALALVTDKGKPATALGKGECGVLAVQRQGPFSSAAFWLAGPNARLRPQVVRHGSSNFAFIYHLNVKAGQTVSLVTGVAQHQLVSPPPKGQLANLFKPFSPRKWLKDLPRALRKHILNLRGYGWGAWLEGGVGLITLQMLDLEPGPADLLALGEETRLHGAADWNRLTVTTRFGRKRIPRDQVLAVVGRGTLARRPCVFLRDGQVLAGDVEAHAFTFVTETGVRLDLEVAGLDRLVMAQAAREQGESPAGHRLLTLSDGNQLAVDPDESASLPVATPWGPREVPLARVKRLQPRQDEPGHLLTLTDGSRFTVFLEQTDLEVQTADFGPIRVPLAEVSGMAAGLPRSEGEADAGAEEILRPHVLLRGDAVLAGRIEAEAIRLASGRQMIPVPPGQVHVLRRTSDPDEGTGRARFEAELWDGALVAGRVLAHHFDVRSGDRLWKVPVEDVTEIVVPSPTVPQAMRDKIAALIRDLGHPDWRTREEAGKQLARVGPLARMQLEEAARHAADPEVRRRAKELLQAIE